jgi:ketosteroid isomerase-like protein
MANEPFCVILVGKGAGVIALDFNLKKEANMSEQESIRVVEEFFAAWNAKDWERWAQLHAENAYHAGPDHAQPLHGREAILTAHQGLGKVFVS